MKCFIDGDNLCVTEDNFVDVQESKCVFIELSQKQLKELNEL